MWGAEPWICGVLGWSGGPSNPLLSCVLLFLVVAAGEFLMHSGSETPEGLSKSLLQACMLLQASFWSRHHAVVMATSWAVSGAAVLAHFLGLFISQGCAPCNAWHGDQNRLVAGASQLPLIELIHYIASLL